MSIQSDLDNIEKFALDLENYRNHADELSMDKMQLQFQYKSMVKEKVVGWINNICVRQEDIFDIKNSIPLYKFISLKSNRDRSCIKLNHCFHEMGFLFKDQYLKKICLYLCGCRKDKWDMNSKKYLFVSAKNPFEFAEKFSHLILKIKDKDGNPLAQDILNYLPALANISNKLSEYYANVNNTQTKHIQKLSSDLEILSKL